jgi:aminoglycoside phosphotransferase (APT) family kinase protein
MNLDAKLVEALFAEHGIREAWAPLRATGVANHIYATCNVVLRLATDHPDAVPNARTEAIAAPVVWSAGILTPQLIAFDDSRRLVDRPYSLWERVHGETLGLVDLGLTRSGDVWHQVGRELSRLHRSVRTCPDPHRHLDTPIRRTDLAPLLRDAADGGYIDHACTKEIEQLIADLRPHLASEAVDCFIHNDLHGMNIMCSLEGTLMALIDWGDAGWADPTLDFAEIPLSFMSDALEGYCSESPDGLGRFPQARFAWDKLHRALKSVRSAPHPQPPLAEFRRFLTQKIRC